MTEQNENEQKAVRIQGNVLGHPIDVTITECDVDTTQVSEVTDPEIADKPDGESAVSEVAAEPVATPADPAPAAAESTDEPKNPEGNAEQL